MTDLANNFEFCSRKNLGRISLLISVCYIKFLLPLATERNKAVLLS